MRRVSRSLLGSLATVWLALLWPVAVAQADPSAAPAVYREAIRLFGQGAYRRAIELFERSNRIYPHPNVLYNLGECYRKLGQLRLSHRHYLRYADTLRGPAQRVFLRKLERLRGKPSTLSVLSEPPGALVRLDGRQLGVTPLARSVSGGEHDLSIALPGWRSQRRRILAEFGEAQAVRISLERLDDPEQADRGRDRERWVLPPPRWRLLVHLWLGPAVGDYGRGRALAVDPELGLRAGVSRLWGRLRLQLDAALFAAPLSDKADGSPSWFVNVLAGAGVLYRFSPGLFAGPRLALGPSLLVGANEQSFVFAPPKGTRIAEFAAGVFPGLLVRPELVVELHLRRGLVLLLTPLAVDYAPLPARQSAAGFRVLRYHFALGLGWRQR